MGYYPPSGDTAFRALINDSPNMIIRRKCLSCESPQHRDIYYQRLTDLPPAEEVDFLDMFMNNWSNSSNNVLGVDFHLYSSYDLNTPEWSYCNYNEEGYGFPLDCGPNEKVVQNWNSYVRAGGNADHHAFYVEKSSEETIS